MNNRSHTRILRTLLSQPENSKCADCCAKGPLWASANLGCFLCIRCAGIHRKLGTHISFVRSVNLDSWKDNHLKNMERIGNKKCNDYYEFHKPSKIKNPSNQSPVEHLERFIRIKYVSKNWVRRNGEVKKSSKKQKKSLTPPSSPRKTFKKNNIKNVVSSRRKRRTNNPSPLQERKKIVIKVKKKKKNVVKKDNSPPLIDFSDMKEEQSHEHLVNRLFSSKQTQKTQNFAFNQRQQPIQMSYNAGRVTTGNHHINSSNMKSPLINNVGQSREQRILGMFSSNQTRYYPKQQMNYYRNPVQQRNYYGNNIQKRPLMMNSTMAPGFQDCFAGNFSQKPSYSN